MAPFRTAVLSLVTLLVCSSSALAARQHVIARVHGSVPVLARPGGAVLTELSSRTAFGSPRVLSVLARSGRWLQVATSDLPARSEGWVDAGTGGLTYSTTPLSITIVLSTRTLELRSGTKMLRAVTVGVGATASPTPTGHFVVTDELPGDRYSTVYGCCIIALSARQTHLPARWHGGDRIAIHGTDQPWTIGRAVSMGCMHAQDTDMRYLLDRVPLGTPVTIVS